MYTSATQKEKRAFKANGNLHHLRFEATTLESGGDGLIVRIERFHTFFMVSQSRYLC